MSKLPTQPIELGKDGIIRFRPNEIVRFLLDAGDIDLNKLAIINFDDEDREQFAQLIGYSVSGYGELSYVSKQSVSKADKIAAKLYEKNL